MRKNFFTLAAILAAIIIYIPVFSPVGILDAPDNAFYHTRINDSAIINNQYHLDQQQSVLYLDFGDAPFFFRANSSCRYVAPLALARNRPGWNLSGLSQYQEEYSCIKNYQGQFIVMEPDDPIGDWLGENVTTMQPIIKMIRTNYTQVYGGSWRIWEKTA